MVLRCQSVSFSIFSRSFGRLRTQEHPVPPSNSGGVASLPARSNSLKAMFSSKALRGMPSANQWGLMGSWEVLGA